jgi:hypothetical protein
MWLAPAIQSNEVVFAHGNGPQLGLLALQSFSYAAGEPARLDVLGAQAAGMIGYLLERELRQGSFANDRPDRGGNRSGRPRLHEALKTGGNIYEKTHAHQNYGKHTAGTLQISGGSTDALLRFPSHSPCRRSAASKPCWRGARPSWPPVRLR